MNKIKIDKLERREIKKELDKFRKGKNPKNKFRLLTVIRYILYFLELVYQMLKTLDEEE